MPATEFTRIRYVAWADFLQRIRSRRLLAVVVIVAYVGYQLNVGTFELLYQDTVGGDLVNYRGEPTAAYVGLSTGVLGATILLFFGYYILSGSIARDRTTDVGELLASTPLSNASYLLGKWLSHVGVVSVLLGALGGAALLNHLLHGTGQSDPVWILGAVFLVGLPLGGFVAGITILFQSSTILKGTLGNIAYLFGALTLLTVILANGSDTTAARPPLWLRLGDLIGVFAAGEMTFDALLASAPGYSGPQVANFGAGTKTGDVLRYYWAGSSWPTWFFASRGVLVLTGLGLVIGATIPYDRFTTSTTSRRQAFSNRLKSRLPTRSRESPTEDTGLPTATDVSFTPAADRGRSGFGRLLIQELRLLSRGHSWWWYLGAAIIVVLGLSGTTAPTTVGPIAAIWPLFAWSELGYRTAHHNVTPLIVSSNQPLGQLLAEWTAGALLTAGFLGVALWPALIEAGVNGILVLAGGVLFIPSLAQFLGLWSHTRRAFELVYLVLWYVGPLNAVRPLDFAGATTETAGTLTPVAFGAIGLLALLGALVHRYERI